MALLSTGILLPSSEELDNQLTSADRDPSLRPLINPTLQTILPCLSCKTCNLSLFISHSNDHHCPLPLPGTTAHEIWFQTVIEAWEEWKLYEASRLLWHIPKIQALHDTSRTATVGWTLAWDAVKTGMRDIWSTKTEEYFRKSKEDWEAKCGRQSGRIHFDYDITPPNLDRIMPPADYDLSRHRNFYNGKDLGYYTHLDYYNRLVAQAEDVAARDFYAEIAALSSALANNPEMEIPHEVYDESKLMYHGTRGDANMCREMQIRNREEKMMETMMRLEAKSTDKGSNNGEDVSIREVVHDMDGDTTMEETLAEATAFREGKWTVYKVEKQKDEKMSRPKVQRTDSRCDSRDHAVHDMSRRSMPAQKGKVRSDLEATQMEEDPFTNMGVDTQPQDTSIGQGLSRAHKKKLKNEQRANKVEMEKAHQYARDETLAWKMDSALNGFAVMHLDEDPFIDAPTEPNPTRDEKAKNAPARAENQVRKADREIERANEHQRVRDEALALEMENALDDLEVMGLEDDMTSPQKKRLQARQLKKVEMERLQALERPRKKTRKSKAKKEKKQRAAAEYYDCLVVSQAGGSMYHNSAAREAATRGAAEREAARLEEMMKRNIEEIRRMCVDEEEKQSGEVVMDLETGKTLGNKRERSESLEGHVAECLLDYDTLAL